MSPVEWYCVIMSSLAFCMAFPMWLDSIDALDDRGTLGDQ